MSDTVLLISNVELDRSTSRGANLTSRTEMLEAEGWETVLGHVPPPYGRTFLPSVLRCIRLARREDVNLITSISNPFHLHLVGLLVALFARCPWIAEFRDPMVDNPDRDPEAVTTKLAAIVEWLVAWRADRIVWGDGIQMEEGYFREKYEPAPDRVQKLPYKGFRRERFASVEPVTYDRFTITYAGSFYDGWIEPYTFLAGLEQYVEEHGQDIRVQFYGDWRPEYDEAVADRGLSKVVSHHEFVPKDEIIPVLRGSDALLHIGGEDPDNRLNVPSKVYDYIGARSPILAVVDPSFRVSKIIKEEQLGIVAAYNNPEAIADAIDEVRQGEGFDPDESVYDRFDRRRKIETLATVYEAVAGRM